MGKFNPANAGRADFTQLFGDVESLKTSSQSQDWRLTQLENKVTPLQQEVTEARGGYSSLDERLDNMGGGGGGTSDYTELDNKPKINGTELIGNMSLGDIGVADAEALESEESARKSEDQYLKHRIGDMIDDADLNLVRIALETKTVSGIQFTVQPDGTIKAHGTATADIELAIGVAYVAGQDYLVLSGCPNVSGVSLSAVDESGEILATDEGDSIDFWVDHDATFVKIVLNISNGTTVSNQVVRPEICMYEKWSTISDYLPSLPELCYAPQRMGIPTINDVIDELLYQNAGRNMLDLKGTKTQTINGITFTVNEDKSITLSGTATATAFFSVPAVLPAGDMFLFGMPEGGGSDSYRLELRSPTATGTVYQVNDSVIPTSFTRQAEWSGYFNVRVASGYSFAAPVTVRPMIMRPSDYAKTSKYAPSTGSLREAVATLVDSGAKNLLDWNARSTATITIVDNMDGTFTASGSPSTVVSIEIGRIYGCAGKMLYLSGCPIGGNQASGYSLVATNAAGSMIVAGADEGNGCAFRAPAGEDYVRIYVRFRTGSYSDLTFAPMVTYDEYAKVSTRFVKHQMSADDVTSQLKALPEMYQSVTDADKTNDALAEVINSGSKNLLQMTHEAGTATRYGVTCTWDPIAGTMTLNGTHAASDSAAIFEFYSGNAVDQAQIPAGEYFLSGCPVGGSTSTYRGTLTSITGGVDTGAGASFLLNQPTYLAYRILISGSVTFDNMVFRPMVCSKDVSNITKDFVPYRPSWDDMWAAIKALQQGGA